MRKLLSFILVYKDVCFQVLTHLSSLIVECFEDLKGIAVINDLLVIITRDDTKHCILIQVLWLLCVFYDNFVT